MKILREPRSRFGERCIILEVGVEEENETQDAEEDDPVIRIFSVEGDDGRPLV